ncbi:MAG: type II toxin-antitoxin system VapC family toxin [Defluviitaleaceae bacterium]|nr:type II toxin-antitoxin system VapC family toxin [Defluviitaleaceae bacterium]
MGIILDTHVAIWFFEGDKRLSKSAIDAICDLDNMIYVSIASVWEVSIKLSTGKLKFDGGIENFIETIYKNEFELLGISPRHTKTIAELPFIHRDPFDRMLVAQAIAEDMAILTVDENIARYEIKSMW